MWFMVSLFPSLHLSPKLRLFFHKVAATYSDVSLSKRVKIDHYSIAAPPPPHLFEGEVDWIFEINEIRGELKFFKIRGKGEFLKFSLGGKLLEMKLQTENKI